VPRGKLVHPVPGGFKYGNPALQVGGVSKIGTIKYGLESRETQTLEGLHWRGTAATVNYGPILSSERVPQNNKPGNV
jgi:CobQ-like glutamine amidotransferase family enzyme